MKTPESALRQMIKVYKQRKEFREEVVEVNQWRINSALKSPKIDATLNGQARTSIGGLRTPRGPDVHSDPAEIDCGNDGQGRVQDETRLSSGLDV